MLSLVHSMRQSSTEQACVSIDYAMNQTREETLPGFFKQESKGKLMQGRIHSLESFGTVDGPGTRFVVFVQGCPMRCAYCHNPDTWEMNGGTLMEPSYIIEQYERNSAFYANGGGLTVTGGEPLMQIDFMIDLFTLAKTAKSLPPIYLSCGEQDRLYPMNSVFARLLETLGAHYRFDHRPGSHTWDFWDRSLRDCMDWLWG